jgi:hypothetical protein
MRFGSNTNFRLWGFGIIVSFRGRWADVQFGPFFLSVSF